MKSLIENATWNWRRDVMPGATDRDSFRDLAIDEFMERLLPAYLLKIIDSDDIWKRYKEADEQGFGFTGEDAALYVDEKYSGWYDKAFWNPNEFLTKFLSEFDDDDIVFAVSDEIDMMCREFEEEFMAGNE